MHGSGVPAWTALRTWQERSRVCRAPLDELLVARQDGVDQLVEHVLGRFAEKVCVGEHGLAVLAIKSRAMFTSCLSRGRGLMKGRGAPVHETRCDGRDLLEAPHVTSRRATPGAGTVSK